MAGSLVEYSMVEVSQLQRDRTYWSTEECRQDILYHLYQTLQISEVEPKDELRFIFVGQDAHRIMTQPNFLLFGTEEITFSLIGQPVYVTLSEYIQPEEAMSLLYQKLSGLGELLDLRPISRDPKTYIAHFRGISEQIPSTLDLNDGITMTLESASNPGEPHAVKSGNQLLVTLNKPIKSSRVLKHALNQYGELLFLKSTSDKTVYTAHFRNSPDQTETSVELLQGIMMTLSLANEENSNSTDPSHDDNALNELDADITVNSEMHPSPTESTALSSPLIHQPEEPQALREDSNQQQDEGGHANVDLNRQQTVAWPPSEPTSSLASRNSGQLSYVSDDVDL